MSDETRAAMDAQLDLQKKIAAMPAPRLCLCGRVLSDEELVRANVDTTPSTCEYQCAECGQVSVFPYTTPAAPAVTLDADAVTLTIAGVGALPQGSVITVSVVVGPDGPVVIPPAATPPAEAEQPKKKRYINGD